MGLSLFLLMDAHRVVDLVVDCVVVVEGDLRYPPFLD